MWDTETMLDGASLCGNGAWGARHRRIRVGWCLLRLVNAVCVCLPPSERHAMPPVRRLPVYAGPSEAAR